MYLKYIFFIQIHILNAFSVVFLMKNTLCNLLKEKKELHKNNIDFN